VTFGGRELPVPPVFRDERYPVAGDVEQRCGLRRGRWRVWWRPTSPLRRQGGQCERRGDSDRRSPNADQLHGSSSVLYVFSLNFWKSFSALPRSSASSNWRGSSFVTEVCPNTAASGSMVTAPAAARAFRKARRSVMGNSEKWGRESFLEDAWVQCLPKMTPDPIQNGPHITRSKGLHKGNLALLPRLTALALPSGLFQRRTDR